MLYEVHVCSLWRKKNILVLHFNYEVTVVGIMKIKLGKKGKKCRHMIFEKIFNNGGRNWKYKRYCLLSWPRCRRRVLWRFNTYVLVDTMHCYNSTSVRTSFTFIFFIAIIIFKFFVIWLMYVGQYQTIIFLIKTWFLESENVSRR